MLLANVIIIPLLFQPNAGIKLLTVCEVLDNLTVYRGRVISITGPLITNEEGAWLSSDSCPKPFVTEGYAWPKEMAINLIRDKSRAVNVDPALENLSKRAKRDEHIWVTVTGKLETRSHFEMVLKTDGTRVPYGFGHLNLSPAELTMYSIGDPAIKKISPKPK
jgi:hypothetical protein